MTEVLEASSIKINFGNGQSVEFYPDELPADVEALEDVLKDTLAPVDVWTATAMEYYRQGMFPEFEHLLEEIGEGLADPALRGNFQGQEEHKIRVFHALAADALMKIDPALSEDDNRQQSERFKTYISRAKLTDSIHLFTWMLDGFFSLKKRDYSTALMHFKHISSAQKAGGKYSFGLHLGLGSISYFQKQYKKALESFAAAIGTNPSCGASVRVALAICCFELQQFDRARLAIERALLLEPHNVEALLMMALLEKVNGHKYKARRAEHHRNAYEYAMLAAHLDRNNAAAWNHVAQYLLLTWRAVSCSEVLRVSAEELRIGFAADCSLVAGDLLRINGSFSCKVQAVQREGKTLTVTVQPPLPSSLAAAQLMVEAKEIGYIKSILHRATKISKIEAVVAESWYLLGRVNHLADNVDFAQRCYEETLRRWPDMPLALFAIAQLLFARNDYKESRRIFEALQEVFPGDRDVNAFLLLIRSVAKERIDFDKLKEAIPGFAFEADIWQLQACLRQSVPSEQSTALKCFEMSVAVMHKCLPGAKVPPNLLSNMSILYLAAGALDNAVQFARRAIVESGQYSGDVRVSESVCSKVFLTEENAFMNAQGAVQVRVVDAEHVVVVAASDDASNSSLPTAGDGILVGGVYMAVEQAEGRELRVTTTVDLPAGDYSAVRVTSGGFVRDDTLTLCFNYARMLEEVGCLAAANEVYGALVDAHPSFAECKMHADFSRFLLMQATRLGFVRMGCINKGSGQYAQAQHWFKRAAEAGDSDALDLQLLVGDVHLRMNEPEKAKHVFEKDAGSKKARAMLLMGNFYFSSLYTSQLQRASRYEEHLKQSYKFFYAVLDEDKAKANVFAASGLGVVCAEKGEMDAAREIFARLRDANPEHTSATVNLAHVYLYQERWVEAISLYASAAKMTKEVVAQGELLEYTAFAQFKSRQLEESIQSLLRAVAYNPTSAVLLCNLALVRQHYAVFILNKTSRTVRDIELAIDELNLAKHSLVMTVSHAGDKSKNISAQEVSKAKALGEHCEAYITKAEQLLAQAQEKEDAIRVAREQQEEEHRQRLALLQQSSVEEAENAERLKKEMRDRVQEKALKLQQMQETWAVRAEPAPSSDKAKKQKKQKKEVRETDDAGDDDEEEEESDSGADVSDEEPAEQQSRSKEKKSKRKKRADLAMTSDDDASKNGDSAGGHAKKKTKTKNAPIVPDIFDSDEELEEAPVTKLVRKAQDGDDDDDIEFETLVAKAEPAVVGNEERPVAKTRRMLLDDDDDE